MSGLRVTQSRAAAGRGETAIFPNEKSPTTSTNHSVWLWDAAVDTLGHLFALKVTPAN